MDGIYKYLAFISYTHKFKDERFANGLLHVLEHYELPLNLTDTTDSQQKKIGPFFIDNYGISGGVLKEVVDQALYDSRFLLVVCSPHSAKAEWVEHEVKTFCDLGRTDKIIPIIIQGIHPSDNPKKECLPPSLCDLLKEKEIFLYNIKKDGRDFILAKVVSRLTEMDFEDIWQRQNKERKKKRNRKIAGVFFAFLLLLIGALRMYVQRQETLKANWKMMENQSRIVAEKANDFIEKGDPYTAQRMLIEVLPKNIESPQDRPYTPEAERSIRAAYLSNIVVLHWQRHSFNRAVFSPDDKFIACATNECEILIWNVINGKKEKTLEGHKSFVYCVSYSPDGRYIVSSAGDFSIKKWDVFTGKEIWSIDNKCITEQDDTDSSVAVFVVFSPDGKYIAAASQDGIIRVLNSENGKIYKTFHNSPIIDFTNSVAFSPDGKYLASDADECVVLWDFYTGEELLMLNGHAGSVRSIVFSPDGKQIVSSHSHEKVILWDITTGDTIHTYNGHQSDVLSVAFSPNGKYIASSSIDRLVKIWDDETGKELMSFEGHEDYVMSVAFSNDSKRVVSASLDNTFRIWDVETAKNNEVRKFSCQEIDKYDGKGILSSCFSSDNRYVLSFLKCGILVKWDIFSGDTIFVVKGHESDVEEATFSPNGKRLYTMKDNDLTVWDTESGIELHTIRDCSFKVFQANEDFIATIDDRTLKLWNPVTGMKMRSLKGHKSQIRLLSLSHDGKYIVSLSEDDTLIVWDGKTKERVNSFKVFQGNTINSVDISPNGKSIVTVSDDRLVKIWDLKTGGLINVLNGYASNAYSARFIMDGNRVVSTSKNLIIWDVESGAIIRSIDLNQLGVSFSASCSTNGQFVLCEGYHEIEIIDLSFLQSFIDQTRERFKDNPLTPEERRMYME